MHSLRGALAVAMIGGGTPVPVVSAVLGHASSDTTQAYHLVPEASARARHALDSAFNSALADARAKAKAQASDAPAEGMCPESAPGAA